MAAYRCRVLIAAIFQLSAVNGFCEEPPPKDDAVGSPQPTADADTGLPRLVSVLTRADETRKSAKFDVVRKGLSLQIVERETGKAVGRPLEHGKPDDDWTLECWMFSPDDKWLATAGGKEDRFNGTSSGCVHLWSVATGEQVKFYQSDDAKKAVGHVRRLAFSADGRELWYHAESMPTLSDADLPRLVSVLTRADETRKMPNLMPLARARPYKSSRRGRANASAQC